MLSIYNICGHLHHVICSDILWISCFYLFLTSQDGNILHKDNLTVKDISQHTFQTTLKDKKFASYWKERLTLNSCLQLVNTRLRARRIRSCVKISHIKLIDQEDQQSKHKLPFSPKKEKIRREKTSKLRLTICTTEFISMLTLNFRIGIVNATVNCALCSDLILAAHNMWLRLN